MLSNLMHRQSSETLREIWDGNEYKKLPLKKHDLTCTFNTDGVAVFKSNKFSLWPILFTINELSYNLRRKYVSVAAFYFGKTKPSFNTFFHPIVTAFQKFCSEELVWTYMDNVYKSSVYFACLVCDSMARCAVQGLTQHNGKFGCNYCLAMSSAIENQQGKRVYLPTYPLPKKRTKESYEACLKVKNTGNNFGVKSRSFLMDIPHFDIIKSCPVDYMHNMCSGVGKFFAVQWLDSKNHSKPYYLGLQIAEIDIILESVAVPNEIPRTIRSLKLHPLWKANEWRTWVLIAPVVLRDCLPTQYLQHFAKFSSAFFILLSSSISSTDLKSAEKLLVEFVCDTVSLYGVSFCTYNMHLLIHVCDSVRWFGPLWNTSCFMFESTNGKLLNLYRGTRYVPDQLSKSIAEIVWLKEQSKPLFQNSDMQPLFLRMLTSDNKSEFFSMSGNVVLTGRKRIVQNTREQLSAILFRWSGELPLNITAYRHCYVNKLKFTAETRSLVRNNATIQTTSDNYYKLTHILNFNTKSLTNLCVGIGVKLSLSNSELGRHVFEIVHGDST